MVRYIVALILLAQAVLFTVEAQADLANSIEIVNGKPMPFTTITNDNWYTFTMGATGQALATGSSQSSTEDGVDLFKIYDESLNEVYSQGDFHSTSVNLSIGKYFINISENVGGEFSIYSEKMNNPSDPTPELGTILNPYLFENGVQLPYAVRDTPRNTFYFGLTSAGNLSVSGSAGNNGINYVYIYDENLNQIYVLPNLYSTVVSLSLGNYYLIVSERVSGTISVFSSELDPNPIIPKTDYLKGYNDGKQACIDDPTSCGIDPGGDFYVIPFPVPAE